MDALTRPGGDKVGWDGAIFSLLDSDDPELIKSRLTKRAD